VLHNFASSGRCEDCALRSRASFCNLPRASLKALDAIKRTMGCPRGVVLFREGDSPQAVFMICTGRLMLSMIRSDGKRVIFRLVKAGEVLGLDSTVRGTPYGATAETLEPCLVGFVRAEDFLRFLRTNPKASLRAAQGLASAYAVACERIRSLAFLHTTSSRLAKFLLDWAAVEHPVKLTLSYEAIGQVIGRSRESVTIAFGELRRKKIITAKRSVVTVQNKAALEKAAREGRVRPG